MIKMSCNNKDIPVNKVTFSDGAFTFKVDLPRDAKYIWVVVDPSTPVSIIREELSLITDCIYQYGKDYFDIDVPMYLSLDYMPHSRCDRKFEQGNPIALEDFCDYVEHHLCGYDKIYTCDLHNDYYPKLIFKDKLIEKSQLECFKHSLHFDTKKDWDCVLSVDKGSRKKAAKIAEYLNVPVYNCEKERDISTGRIIKSELPDVDFSGKNVLIPDDLSDGAGSFVGLASQLKEAGAKRVDLYVTHAIFAKGLDVCKGSIDNIYCYHVVGNYINKEDIMKFNLREEKNGRRNLERYVRDF
jgi:ribose-phosphate pyrophosphokinase